MLPVRREYGAAAAAAAAADAAAAAAGTGAAARPRVRRPVIDRVLLSALGVGLAFALGGCGSFANLNRFSGSDYPWHTDIVATTFWVGEVFDASAADGSQVYSTYDSRWQESYGGCDGVVVNGTCETEPRNAADDFFPSSMAPQENPFYLDLPFDDINDEAAFARRDEVIPWAGEEGYAEHSGDNQFSFMKNRWVELRRGDRTCFAQIEDAGPGEYNDAEYVFGRNDQRPANTRYGGAGMDVSPAVNACLGFAELNGDNDSVDWRFVDGNVPPAGPWTRVVTTSGVQ